MNLSQTTDNRRTLDLANLDVFLLINIDDKKHKCSSSISLVNNESHNTKHHLKYTIFRNIYTNPSNLKRHIDVAQNGLHYPHQWWTKVYTRSGTLRKYLIINHFQKLWQAKCSFMLIFLNVHFKAGKILRTTQFRN